MTDDEFDKELSNLYQQRKAEIIAPNVDIPLDNGKVKYSPLTLLALFLVACSASFGIMAIISHFAKEPVTPPKSNFTLHITELKEVPTLKNVDPTVIPTKPLPPKPVYKSPMTQTERELEKSQQQQAIQIDIDGNITPQQLNLPQLSKPLAIKPTYKVMPKYSNNDAQEGKVDLSYNVDESGKVINIKVLDSTVNRGLQRSAKNALSKWRYQSSAPIEDALKIRFEFTQDKS